VRARLLLLLLLLRFAFNARALTRVCRRSGTCGALDSHSIISSPMAAAPAHAPAPVFNFAPPPTAPPTYREWFDQLPANKAAARRLHDAAGAKQGLAKYQALVWNQHAGVDPQGNPTNPAVLLRMIEFANARIEHFEAVKAHPVYGQLGLGDKELKLAQKSAKSFRKALNNLNNI